MANKSSQGPSLWIYVVALVALSGALALLWNSIGVLRVVATALLAALMLAAWVASRHKSKAAVLEAENEQLILDIASANEKAGRCLRENAELKRQIGRLLPYQKVIDIEKHIKALSDQAASERQELLDLAQRKSNDADDALKKAEARAAQLASLAISKAQRLIAEAKNKADELAGDAYAAKAKKEEYEQAARAMRNIIEGYGDEYIIPTYSLLDELADEFGHTQAGEHLKQAREQTRKLIRLGRAATCEYVEGTRRSAAIRFVIDAFNGKVDSILSRRKADNVGILTAQIEDAYALVNTNGDAFRGARITKEFLNARLDELKWSVITHELREKEREEQRRIKEQIREEERAQREFERAMRDAAREEEVIRKAMEKVQQQAAAASDAQREEFESKLLGLEAKLQAAEEKNRRALSMAQQTRTGHVYVISNIGSFGEEVFKIGMTRRLEPMERVRELGDASVPFAFDIHAMIMSDDAPGLEKLLHRHFLRQQINKVNPRKEFFRLGLPEIRRELEALGIETHWTMTAEAHEYRETLKIEQQIEENPMAELEWARHQSEFDPEQTEEAVY